MHLIAGENAITVSTMVIGIKPCTLNIVLVAIKENIPGHPLSVHSEPELDKSNITQSLIQHIPALSHGSDITFPMDNTQVLT